MREVANFLLDPLFQSSILIPKIFRFANVYLRPDFEYLLGRSFINLIPFFTNESIAQTNQEREFDIFIGFSDQDVFILMHVDASIPNFEALRMRISHELQKYYFHLHGEINNVKTRISKLQDLRNNMKVIVTLENFEKEEKL
jgi:hypothetical protein